MPKQKTHSGAKKRFTLKKSGVIKKNKQNRRHILTKKSKDRKRALKRASYVSNADYKNVKEMLNS